MSFPYPGPVPPWTNPPIQSDFFQPGQFFITDITLGLTTTVTTTLDLTSVVGQLMRLVIPPQFGCRQLNGQTGYAMSFPASNQVELAIDSSKNVDQFISASATTQPQLLTVGDINSGTTNSNGRTSTGTVVPGAFINTSPIGAT